MTPGQRIGGRFEVQRQAGAGGMGVVFRALDLHTGHAVALKMIRDRTPDALHRFAREARALAALRHPRIVEFVDHGASEDGSPFLVTEWLDGEDLASRCARGPLSLAETLSIAVATTTALAFAESRGVVHRDIKPANLFLVAGAPERLKLLDFGIARLSDATYAITGTGTAMGTPAYMAPEQARGAPDIDARADLFSLGCVLFECLTGRPPFMADHAVAVLAKILFEDAPRAVELRPGLPPEWSALINRLLEKNPAERPPGAAALLDELRALRITEAISGDATRAAGRRASLTLSEKRLVSVVLIAPRAGAKRALTPVTPLNVWEPFSDRTLDALSATLPAVPMPSFEMLRQIAERHGARLEVMRDGSVAAVLLERGTPADLAAKASRCALALRALFPVGRVALATGWDVVAGTQPVGQPIDRAAALLNESTEGELGVVLDRMTVDLLPDQFDTSVIGSAVVLHGEREPADEARRLLGKRIPCVGRDRELSLLQGIFDECGAEPAARAVLVTGEPGVGKSRLRHELVRRLLARGEPLEVWIARGDPMRAGAPLGLLGQVVRRAAKMLDGEPLDVRQRKLVDRVAKHVSGALRARVAEFLGEIVSVPFPAEEGVQLRLARQDAMLMSDQMRRAWVDFIEAECRAQPVLLVLEDLHWGDRPTVEYVDLALRALREQPFMVLALARPEVRNLFPDLWSERNAMELRLSELSRKSCEKLIREALGELPSALITKLVERSAGNAVFLEELIRAVADGRASEVPDTVIAMTQARIHGVAVEGRRALRAGSVLGDVFWRGAVRALLGGGFAAPEVDDWLADLEKRELIICNTESTFQGEREYVFRHSLVREATYGTLTDEDRALGHRLAAAWLTDAGEAEAYVIAEHYDRGDDRAAAALWYHRAAEQALAASDLAGSIARADRALVCGAQGEALPDLLLIKTVAHRWLGQTADAERCAAEVISAGPVGGLRWCSAMGELLDATARLGLRGRFVDLIGVLESAPLAAGAECAHTIAMATAAMHLFLGGEYERGNALVVRLEAAFHRSGDDPGTKGHFILARARQSLFSGRHYDNYALLKDAISAFEQAGDTLSICRCRINAANTCNLVGAYSDAADLLRTALKDAERMGLRDASNVAKHVLGRSLCRLGLLSEAHALEAEAVKAFAAQGDHRLEAASRLYLAEILHLEGNLKEAIDEARRALDSVKALPPFACEALAGLAWLLLSQGNVHASLEHARKSNDILDKLGQVEEGEALARLVLAEALNASGETAASQAVISAARARILERARGAPNSTWQRYFIEDVPEHARTLSLARAWLRSD